MNHGESTPVPSEPALDAQCPSTPRPKTLGCQYADSFVFASFWSRPETWTAKLHFFIVRLFAVFPPSSPISFLLSFALSFRSNLFLYLCLFMYSVFFPLAWTRKPGHGSTSEMFRSVLQAAPSDGQRLSKTIAEHQDPCSTWETDLQRSAIVAAATGEPCHDDFWDCLAETSYDMDAVTTCLRLDTLRSFPLAACDDKFTTAACQRVFCSCGLPHSGQALHSFVHGRMNFLAHGPWSLNMGKFFSRAHTAWTFTKLCLPLSLRRSGLARKSVFHTIVAHAAVTFSGSSMWKNDHRHIFNSSCGWYSHKPHSHGLTTHFHDFFGTSIFVP